MKNERIFISRKGDPSVLKLISDEVSPPCPDEILIRVRAADVYRPNRITMRGVELYCCGTGIGQLGIDAFFSLRLPGSDVESLAITLLKLDLGNVNYY